MAKIKDYREPGNRYNLKYDKDKHPDSLIKIFANGDSWAKFCAENSIGEKTFYNWLDRYPEFADAYAVARMKALAWWEDRGKKGIGQEHFSATAWSMVMRNRFNYTEHRRIQIPGFDEAVTPIDKLKKIETAVGCGTLTGSEINYMVGLVEAGVRVLQNTKMEDDLELIKTTLGIKS